MEWFWYVIAALGAGVGTGLAGLSAATVMVPILIVLCPSFAGETGAYQATAIALASDILGSAVTTLTYARHGRIDLRRGWIMLACVLVMCVAGSWAAYAVGNVVLGSFTLVLTLCIGIRFLVKPDSGGDKPEGRGQKLDLRGVIISVFFGLTIGFGAGFVGSGGGMMMLVVFTAFLGMEYKTAVGTSTFIMTFTALIASVAHMVIHPAILLQRWPVLLVCVVVATAASLVSARFANCVSNRTVGLATGVVLTVLGAAMLLLKFWPSIAGALAGWPSPGELALQTLGCLRQLVLFVVPAVLALLAIRFLAKPPQFVFRKMLHVVAFTCFTVVTLGAASWQSAALASVVVAVVVYPLLALAERASWYARLFVQKSPGEIKRSLLMLFFMFAAVISVAWGAFGKPLAAAGAIMMWGTGDAVAALVGIPLGRHKVTFRPVCGKKSWEGSAAMLVVSFVVGFCLLGLYGGLPVGTALTSALVGALVGTATELVSDSEWDTVTVPVAVLVVLLALA